MIMDQNLVFCESTDAEGTVGTANLGDVIDLGQSPSNRLTGSPVALVVQLTEAVAGSGARIAVQLVSDAIATPAVNGTQTIHAVSGPFAVGDAVGKKVILPLPSGMSYERYLGVQAVRSGATSTTGGFTAFLTMDAQDWTPMADAEGRIYGA